MTKRLIVFAATVWLAASSFTHAQQPVTKSASVTATATIQALDQANRRITLRNDKGEEDSFTVGPAVTRFDQLKVGDTVRMTYYESMVFQVRKPGEKANPASDEAALTRAKGALPGGTISRQEKRTVTVKAVDPAVPSITVTTDDGRTISGRSTTRRISRA
jgi:Cu/Ag efflux protein CusF